MRNTYVNDLGAQLRDQDLLVGEEEDAAGFLGVTMTRDDKGVIELKQTGLINSILEALGLDTKHTTGKYTPSKTSPLTKENMGQDRRDLSVMPVLLA